MKKVSFLPGIFAIAISFFACQKDDLRNLGPSNLGVKIEALNKSYSLPVTTTKSALSGETSITWDSAHLVVSKIKFEAELKSLVTHRDSIEISF